VRFPDLPEELTDGADFLRPLPERPTPFRCSGGWDQQRRASSRATLSALGYDIAIELREEPAV
jgi:hypothetical protein